MRAAGGADKSCDPCLDQINDGAAPPLIPASGAREWSRRQPLATVIPVAANVSSIIILLLGNAPARSTHREIMEQTHVCCYPPTNRSLRQESDHSSVPSGCALHVRRAKGRNLSRLTSAATGLKKHPPLFSGRPLHRIREQGLVFRQIMRASIVADGQANDARLGMLHDEDARMRTAVLLAR